MSTSRSPDAASLSERRAEAEDYLDWFRHSANPHTLGEANVIADELATLLEEVLGGDDAGT